MKGVDLDEADDWLWSLCVLWAAEWLRPNFRCNRLALLARKTIVMQQLVQARQLGNQLEGNEEVICEDESGRGGCKLVPENLIHLSVLSLWVL